MKIEVRNTTRGRVLVIDGQRASLWRQGRVTTGSIWDLLGATILLAPARRRRRVLLLGVGAGSVARLVRALDPSALIWGVEHSPEVLAAARAHFELDDIGMRLHVADARAWLARRSRPAFDLIIDDVYLGSTRNLAKPPGWGASLRRAWDCLREEGLLVANVVCPADERLTEWVGVGNRVRLQHRGYDNRFVLVRRGAPLVTRQIRPCLASFAPLRRLLAQTTIRGLPSSAGRPSNRGQG